VAAGAATTGRVVRVLPDEPAIDKTFDYLVPEALGGQDQLRVGTRVRIALGGRRVGGWIVAVDVSPPAGVTPRPLAKISGHGPSPDLLDLAQWAAWRWAGRPASFLRTASPERVVSGLPTPARPVAAAAPSDPLVDEAFAAGTSVVRLPPAADVYSVVRAAAGLGNALVICPTVAMARALGMRLRRDGVGVAFHPRDWAAGAAGATVIGTRAAAWAPVADLAAVVVVDEHDEGHAQEQAPTWHARDVVAERARRAGVPCVLVSPCPSLEALGWGEVMAPSRSDERAGWPIVDVVDRRQDDPRTGLISPRLVDSLRDPARRVVCVLNRTGRAKLLACSACGDLARCEACDAALSQVADDGRLECPRCGTTRPVVCGSCNGTRLKLLRQGVSRVREELEALVGQPVAEVSSLKDQLGPRERTRVMVGTEAILHQVDAADVVAFLDLDQELLVPRYRAAEEALSLLTRAARLVGGKAAGGRLLLQTRVPDHDVVQAVLQADPERVADAESARRALLRFPPATAMAEVSGAAAPTYIAALRASLPRSAEPTVGAWDAPAAAVEILGPADNKWLVRAPGHKALCDALAVVQRPPGRLRLAVDPLRV
jgi:primosomal protein N' (replication factor Y)